MKIQIDLDFLDAYKLKAKRKSKKSYPDSLINTALIYETVQGNGKNKGINIDLRLPQLRDYSNARIYLMGKLLYIVPVTHYEDDNYRISLNRDNSRLATIKIGNASYADMFKGCDGVYNIKQFVCNSDYGESTTYYLIDLSKKTTKENKI